MALGELAAGRIVVVGERDLAPQAIDLGAVARVAAAVRRFGQRCASPIRFARGELGFGQEALKVPDAYFGAGGAHRVDGGIHRRGAALRVALARFDESLREVAQHAPVQEIVLEAPNGLLSRQREGLRQVAAEYVQQAGVAEHEDAGVRAGGAARHRQRFLGARERLGWKADVPERPRQVDRGAWHVAHAIRLVAAFGQGERVFQVLARIGEVALVQAGLAELGVGVEESAGVLARDGEHAQLFGGDVRAFQIGAQEDDVPEAGVIVSFMQIDTLDQRYFSRDKHLQKRLFVGPAVFGAD